MSELMTDNQKNLIDTTNQNNHAGLKRLEASEKAEAVLKVINDYRMYAQRYASLPTWDVLEFLSRLQKELFKSYEEELTNGERDKLREEYFVIVGKKPFLWWSTEKIKEELEKFKANNQLKYLKDKKSEWKKK